MLSQAKTSTLSPSRATIGRMSIGDRVRARRVALKLTQQQLASQVGLTRGAVSQLEKNMTHDPKPEHLLKYAKALGLHVDELVYGHPPRAEEPRAAYSSLSAAEKVLIDYIRASGRDDRQRDSLARVALSLLLAVAAQAVPDDRLPPQWDIRNRKEKK